MINIIFDKQLVDVNTYKKKSYLWKWICLIKVLTEKFKGPSTDFQTKLALLNITLQSVNPYSDGFRSNREFRVRDRFDILKVSHRKGDQLHLRKRKA
jgi:hypothetical protein